MVQNMENTKQVLDFGCGKNKTIGSIGIDNDPNSDADVFHNLNELPYPFDSNTFDVVYCNNILEHLPNLIWVMEELWRICKDGAIIKINTPHCSSCSAWADITHIRAFNTKAWSKIDKGYYSARFKYEVKSIKLVKVLPMNRKLEIRNPKWFRWWENYFCYWIGGFNGMLIELKVVK